MRLSVQIDIDGTQALGRSDTSVYCHHRLTQSTRLRGWVGGWRHRLKFIKVTRQR